MNIEETMFKKSVIDFSKLIQYGFIKENNYYLYSKKILNDSFIVNIKIDCVGYIKGNVIDLNTHEEYTNFRINNLNGQFVNSVREEYTNILFDIKQQCFKEKYFITNQANRITNLIINRYGEFPKFVWQKFPGYGIFKNSTNDKWYGLIMNINKHKLNIKASNEEIEILNVKLNEAKISKLLTMQGFYKAYHMNKRNWITIILDDTLTDKEILNYIIESHQYSEKVKIK
jgi:predicted DNA-binding protein (MmcQ/YjbR family)